MATVGVFCVGVFVALTAHNTAPGVYVGTALVIGGLIAAAIEDRA